MSEPLADPRAWIAGGIEALRRGDARTARELLGRATESGTADPAVWFARSVAERQLGAAAAEAAALDRTLELDPRHLGALIRKGDLHAQASDARASTSFYRAALKIAAATPGLPTEWQGELARIQAACTESSRIFEQHLLAELARLGATGREAARFQHALDLLLGRRQVHLQRPQYFYFPELPQIQFYDARQFAWAEALERSTPQIRAEAQAVLQSGAGLVPYMQREPNRPAFNTNGLLDDPSWSAFHLIREGAEVPSAAERCPRTLAALRELPLCRIPGRTPTALFSVLRPGTRIPPHHGYLNIRLIGHLPLIVPPQCALRVGNETRPWREGELVLFDDTIEHEAWNSSNEVRVVLLFDIWRPELSEHERSWVAGMLESIDRFGGERRPWTQ